ncbi:MAG: hypothetical protein RLO81_15270 [Fulvivirga sp.]|uniref:hypothetical protein n=1 Tax=Fulvivirga sp. TaxID=1931237 RepID=UPI0032EB8A54
MKKYNNFIYTITFFLLTSGFISCQKKANSGPNKMEASTSQEFNDYWYAGVAEVNSYNLTQARYGEEHEGKAVLIFVTEPFSKSKQVKLDYPDQNPDDKQTVLKLNFTKKFTTGIYPYSMMLSSFTPVETIKYPNTVKVTMSSQEWCGHVYSQMNLNKNNYDLASFSYFEQEGDVSKKIEKAFLEDEIWNLIRLNPQALPTGSIEIIPGLFHTRLLHKNLEPKMANASISDNGNKKTYRLEYLGDKRVLTINFQSEFPYKIVSWSEKIVGLNGNEITTSAELDKTLLIDYWSKNQNKHSYLRDSLNLLN